jgi:hypothetical protein
MSWQQALEPLFHSPSPSSPAAYLKLPVQMEALSNNLIPLVLYLRQTPETWLNVKWRAPLVLG